MAKAFHFGESARPLYGVYHAPEARQTGPAVLLLNPFGEEAIRAFRIYRLIAERLARAGVATLRFDYEATGDSAGDCAKASLSLFEQSTLAAHEELLDLSGASSAIWIGLRLGASVALRAAARAERLAGLILWDPISVGAEYLRELAAGHQAALRALLSEEAGAAPILGEALGFEIPPTLENDLRAFSIDGMTPPRPRRVVLVGEPDSHAFSIWRARVRAEGADLQIIEDPDSSSWNSDRALNSYVVPQRTVNAIVEAASAWR
jgi:pimeloyl-ACP methyl ester carboxylesterase